MYFASVNGSAAPALKGSPLARYRDLVRNGALRPDPVQELAAEKLESLHHALTGYRPRGGAPEAGSWRGRFGLAKRTGPAPPQGLYLYGGVGRGKSMLMDLFFETAPVVRKRRVHFNAFMVEVHQRVHAWRQAVKAGKAHGDDPIPPLADHVADEAWLLCFDEFHVVDIADAMILGRLFTRLFDMGIIVVATSNWPPDDLYKDGLNRDLIMPFIALVKERMDVLHLDSATDYRLDRLRGMTTYHQPLGPVTARNLSRAFAELTEGALAEPITLTVQGRRLPVPKAARGVGWFDFDALCATALGSADYLAIARRFHTVVLDRIPRLKPDQRNEVKRFILLVDALYEHRVKLIAAADGPPEAIYAEGLHAFEFQRTVSRLMEMQSADWMERPHVAGEQTPVEMPAHAPSGR